MRPVRLAGKLALRPGRAQGSTGEPVSTLRQPGSPGYLLPAAGPGARVAFGFPGCLLVMVRFVSVAALRSAAGWRSLRVWWFYTRLLVPGVSLRVVWSVGPCVALEARSGWLSRRQFRALVRSAVARGFRVHSVAGALLVSVPV